MINGAVSHQGTLQADVSERQRVMVVVVVSCQIYQARWGSTPPARFIPAVCIRPP